MARLEWDKTGERLYETGTDRGVLYVASNGAYPTGVAWNGLTGVAKRGSPYLRRAIWQASTAAATFDPHMKAFFQKKRAEGKPYMNAIGHVTRKMTNIIFAVLRDNKPYYNPDEL